MLLCRITYGSETSWRAGSQVPYPTGVVLTQQMTANALFSFLIQAGNGKTTTPKAPGGARPHTRPPGKAPQTGTSVPSSPLQNSALCKMTIVIFCKHLTIFSGLHFVFCAIVQLLQDQSSGNLGWERLTKVNIDPLAHINRFTLTFYYKSTTIFNGRRTVLNTVFPKGWGRGEGVKVRTEVFQCCSAIWLP